ncbi:MAG TPA: XrtA/PEP-CTERM system-associated ATPase [Aliidongia sp.]|uniref:XrtA/PEP-CTERM system-associated ATPase n=1 Tax=Aliidongia sp. TaxID=1914230 RepID=UPI002DDCF171|nr:XrtA/PEP-CTERM system-associated ATPase [Aliidongia sp.]HEV2678763.1 XrtA/PEP-CTERM system-associated ATPase [Aliidongia sp.]
MYEKFFGFHSHPFRLTPDPNLFFGSRGHIRAHSYLTFGLSQGEGFVVVTGDVGAGKTTLLSHLLAGLQQEQQYRVARIVTSHLNAEDTLRMIVSAFGVPETDGSKASLLRQMEALLTEAAASGERCLLIVDEVQNMPFPALEELRMLSNIEVPDGAPLQTILVGQPEFRDAIASPQLQQLQQRVVASCHLLPMEESEVKDYVIFRLEQAGWSGDPGFADGVFEEIYHHTRGVPRRINVLCARLLLHLCLDERHILSVEDVADVAEELKAETASTQPEGSMPHYPTSTGISAAMSHRVSDLSSDHEIRLAALEERVRRHDMAFRRALLSLSDYISEVNLGAGRKP